MNHSQAGLLAYLKSCRANGQATPTLREIGAHFGVHQQTAHEWMKALVAAGKIERRFKTPRMVKIIADATPMSAASVTAVSRPTPKCTGCSPSSLSLPKFRGGRQPPRPRPLRAFPPTTCRVVLVTARLFRAREFRLLTACPCQGAESGMVGWLRKHNSRLSRDPFNHDGVGKCPRKLRESPPWSCQLPASPIGWFGMK